MRKSSGADRRPYRKGVGAVLFDARGRVFVAARCDTPDDAWQMPQGGIDDGEKPRAAVMRELKEEIGTDKAEIVAESKGWIAYDLPPDLQARVWGGRYRGQKQKWFALRFTGVDRDIDLEADGSPEFRTWKWVPFDEVPRLIVAFKRPLYEAVVAEFRAVAARLVKAAAKDRPKRSKSAKPAVKARRKAAPRRRPRR